MSTEQEVGTDQTFEALKRTDRCCRLIVKQLRESYPFILEGPEFEKLVKQTRRQFRETRELLGTAPPPDQDER